MGARQSKRSVDISAGATKAEKGPTGEPLENGTITASGDDKQVVEANGVEETPKQNGSTPHVDEKEIAETEAPPVDDVKEPTKPEDENAEAAAPVPVSEANGDLDTTADESIKSPNDESSSVEVPASAEKKRKKKKTWSFRSISFSKKDKSKPAVKEQSAADVKAETVQEVVEEDAVKEEAKPETETAVEVTKAPEEPSAAVEEKEPVAEVTTTSVAEIPPPLPSSPPPVETPDVPVVPAEPTVPTEKPVLVEPTVPTPTIVETPAPVQPSEPEVAQTEPEDETVGGGEGLAEPPEGLNTSDIEKEVAEVPLVNGNHVEIEKSEPSSPDVTCVAEKIEALKLSNTADMSEVTNEISNDSHEVNGVSDAIVTNGNDGGDY